MVANPLLGIDSIPWSTLGHAYGSAEDVPELLESLRSNDEKVWDNAYYQLQGNIYHQGTRYSASVESTPWLYALLDAEDTPHRDRVLDLIVNLAVGFPNSFIPNGLKIQEWRAHIARISEPVEDQVEHESDDDLDDERSKAWKRRHNARLHVLEVYGFRTYEAVQAGLTSVYALMNDEDAEVRAMAAYSLTFFPEKFGETQPLLLRRLEVEEDAVIRGTVLVALAILCNSLTDASPKITTAKSLEDYCSKGSSDSFTKWVKNATLVIVGRSDPEKVEELVQWMVDAINLHDKEPVEDCFPFGFWNLLEFSTTVLKSLKGTEHPYAARIVVDHLPDVNPIEAIYLTLNEAAVKIAFDGSLPSPVPPFADLSELQQGVIRAVWKSGKDNGKKYYCLSGMFSKWETPSAQEIEEYISSNS